MFGVKKIFYYLFFSFLIFLFHVSGVYAINTYQFTESADFDSSAGTYMACTSPYNSNIYCIHYTSMYGYGTVYSIDINNESSTMVTSLSQRIFYTSIKKVTGGYLAVGLSLSGGTGVQVTYFDESFQVVESNFQKTAISSSMFIEEYNNSYYILNEGILSSNYVAIKVSDDFKSYTYLTTNDLSSESDDVCDMIYAFKRFHDSIDKSSELMMFFSKFNGGYLMSYTNFEGKNAGFKFLKNDNIVWEKNHETIYYGNLIVKDDHFYVSFEDTENYYTSFDEYSSDGVLLNSTPITILNEEERFLLGNFVIGEYNNKILFLSYSPKPSNEFGEQTKWRILYLNLSSEISVVSSEGGNVSVNKENAVAGEEIQIKIKETSGYEVKSIHVTDFYGNDVSVSNYRFIMPNSKVMVNVSFQKKFTNPQTSSLITVFVAFVTLFLLIVFSIYYDCYKKEKLIDD